MHRGEEQKAHKDHIFFNFHAHSIKRLKQSCWTMRECCDWSHNKYKCTNIACYWGTLSIFGHEFISVCWSDDLFELSCSTLMDGSSIAIIVGAWKSQKYLINAFNSGIIDKGGVNSNDSFLCNKLHYQQLKLNYTTLVNRILHTFNTTEEAEDYKP